MPNIVAAIQAHYHETYGLSLRGLTKHHSVDPLDFGKYILSFIDFHDLLYLHRLESRSSTTIGRFDQKRSEFNRHVKRTLL